MNDDIIIRVSAADWQAILSIVDEKAQWVYENLPGTQEERKTLALKARVEAATLTAR